jgi:1,4-dihydroxy-2-naphthoate octaprenyltransferase
MSFKTYFLETRPQFLILAIILAFLGTTIAWYDGYFSLWHALLAGFGLLLAHISVNTLNDYFDYKSGIDLATRRTPFSGGSGMLPTGLLKPSQVFWLGLGSLLVAVPIGVYFIIVKGWLLLPLLLVAALLVLIYTPFILKTPYPEWAAGLGLGILPVLGIYFAQAGAYALPVLYTSVPSGILVHNLLFLNEFPDVEADRKAGRKTTPIIAGQAKASVVYIVMTIMVYAWIIAGVILQIMPAWASVALLTIPLAIKAMQGSRKFDEPDKFIPAMASNVLVVLLTQLLLGIGYILARVFG